MRLKQKVTKLEALLARSCERLRSTNVLKHGLEYQMTGKVRNFQPTHLKFWVLLTKIFSSQKLLAFYHVLEPIWELLHLPRALERPHSMVIWNRANHISCTLHRALLMLKSCSFVIIVLILLQCILVPNLIQTHSEPFRTDFKPVQTSFNRFGPVWTSTKRSDSLLSFRTEPKSFIFIPITIYIYL